MTLMCKKGDKIVMCLSKLSFVSFSRYQFHKTSELYDKRQSIISNRHRVFYNTYNASDYASLFTPCRMTYKIVNNSNIST